jgi:hypothetical protein
MDRRVSTGRRAGLDYGQRVRGSDELQRRTTHSGELHGLRRRAANSGDERQRTSDERGVLEGEANSSRQEWGGSAAFYREQEGRRKGHWWSSSVLPFPARNGRRNGRRERKNKSPLTRWINHAHKRTDGGFSNGHAGSSGVSASDSAVRAESVTRGSSRASGSRGCARGRQSAAERARRGRLHARGQRVGERSGEGERKQRGEREWSGGGREELGEREWEREKRERERET